MRPDKTLPGTPKNAIAVLFSIGIHLRNIFLIIIRSYSSYET